jgi:uncharacterized membrane protein (UPF0127 family)
VGRTTRSDQLRGRAARDNPRVADHVDLTRTDGQLVCRCRVANSFASRFRGLMGVAQLPPGTGLLLPGTSSVHTHFMRFPIDLVFLDSERRIVSITRGVRPWRFAKAKDSDSVLELAAGECDRLGLAAGTALIEAEG